MREIPTIADMRRLFQPHLLHRDLHASVSVAPFNPGFLNLQALKKQFPPPTRHSLKKQPSSPRASLHRLSTPLRFAAGATHEEKEPAYPTRQRTGRAWTPRERGKDPLPIVYPGGLVLGSKQCFGLRGKRDWASIAPPQPSNERWYRNPLPCQRLSNKLPVKRPCEGFSGANSAVSSIFFEQAGKIDRLDVTFVLQRLNGSEPRADGSQALLHAAHGVLQPLATAGRERRSNNLVRETQEKWNEPCEPSNWWFPLRDSLGSFPCPGKTSQRRGFCFEPYWGLINHWGFSVHEGALTSQEGPQLFGWQTLGHSLLGWRKNGNTKTQDVRKVPVGLVPKGTTPKMGLMSFWFPYKKQQKNETKGALKQDTPIL